MRKLLKLAWRNVWRNRRRTLLTMAAVVFSMLIVTLTRSLQYGTYDAVESYAIRLFSGDVQVQRAGYLEEQTLSYSLAEDERDWAAVLAAQPGVTAWTRRLTGYGLLSSAEASAGALILGVEPDAEPRVTGFLDRVDGGSPLAPGDDAGALLGEALARNLALTPGDTVVVLTQGYHNAMGAEVYVVRGLVRTGSADLDRNLMVLSLPAAQQLFAMPGRFTQIVLRTDDFRRAAAHAARLRDAFDDDRVAVLDWDTLMPDLRQMIVLDNVSGAIFLGFMLILIGFEIFNTTMMSVMERVREFGILQAIGMKPGQIGGLVLLELGIKVAVALAVSMALCGALVLYLSGHPLPLTESIRELYEDFGFSIDAYVFSGRAAVFLEPLISVTAITLVVMLYPAWRVRRFSPTEALRRA